MEGRLKKNENSNGVDNVAFQLQEKGEFPGYLKNVNQNVSSNQGPKRKKSLIQLTREALPRLENYRNSRKAVKRPSLGELHEGEEINKVR